MKKLVLIGFLSAVLAISISIINNAHAEELSKSDAQDLATTYRPILELHPDEYFAPININNIASNPDATYPVVLNRDGYEDIILTRDDIVDLSLKPGVTSDSFIDLPANAYEDMEKDYTVYYRVFYNPDNVYPYAIQYWFFYYRNLWGVVLHEGDWESITIFLDDLKLAKEVALSTHYEAHRYSWSNSILEKTGNRLHVYVSKGGHGSYAYSGKTCYEAYPEWPDDIPGCAGQWDHHEGGGAQLSDYWLVGLKEFENTDNWLNFEGTFGDYGNPKNPFLRAGPPSPLLRTDAPNEDCWKKAINAPSNPHDECKPRDDGQKIYGTYDQSDGDLYGPWRWAQGYPLNDSICQAAPSYQPTNLTASQVSNTNQIDLSWDDQGWDSVNWYLIIIKNNNSTEVDRRWISANNITYENNTCNYLYEFSALGGTYYWTVKAANNGGNGQESDANTFVYVNDNSCICSAENNVLSLQDVSDNPINVFIEDGCSDIILGGIKEHYIYDNRKNEHMEVIFNGYLGNSNVSRFYFVNDVNNTYNFNTTGASYLRAYFNENSDNIKLTSNAKWHGLHNFKGSIDLPKDYAGYGIGFWGDNNDIEIVDGDNFNKVFFYNGVSNSEFSSDYSSIFLSIGYDTPFKYNFIDIPNTDGYLKTHQFSEGGEIAFNHFNMKAISVDAGNFFGNELIDIYGNVFQFQSSGVVMGEDGMTDWSGAIGIDTGNGYLGNAYLDKNGDDIFTCGGNIVDVSYEGKTYKVCDTPQLVMSYGGGEIYDYIIVTSFQLPLVTPPADITVSASSASGTPSSNYLIQSFLNGAEAIDDVGGTISNVTNDAPSIFPLGTTLVTFTATDSHGKTGTAQAIVTVFDAVGPVVNEPSSITVAATDANGTAATEAVIASFLASATAYDFVDGVVPVANDALGIFPLGETTVTFSATDNAGNTGTAQASVTVTDQTSPVVSVPSDITVPAVDENGTPATNEQIASFLEGASATDNVDGSISAISNDAPGTFPLGKTTVTFSATDNSGNVGFGYASITVREENDIFNIAPIIRLLLFEE